MLLTIDERVYNKFAIFLHQVVDVPKNATGIVCQLWERCRGQTLTYHILTGFEKPWAYS